MAAYKKYQKKWENYENQVDNHFDAQTIKKYGSPQNSFRADKHFENTILGIASLT